MTYEDQIALDSVRRDIEREIDYRTIDLERKIEECERSIEKVLERVDALRRQMVE